MCCCFPEDPHECFVHAAAALDLADRLQTPIFVMTDLDIGMNQRLCAPVRMGSGAQSLRPRQGDERRGELEAGAATSAATRTSTATASPGARCPARIPTKGSVLYARHHARRRMRATPRSGADYIYNMERLLQRKFQTAATLVPQPVLRPGRADPRDVGVIHFGSTSAVDGRRRWSVLDDRRTCTSTRCACAPSRSPTVRGASSWSRHDKVFVVEQNRDAQMHSACWSTNSTSIRVA